MLETEINAQRERIENEQRTLATYEAVALALESVPNCPVLSATAKRVSVHSAFAHAHVDMTWPGTWGQVFEVMRRTSNLMLYKVKGTFCSIRPHRSIKESEHAMDEITDVGFAYVQHNPLHHRPADATTLVWYGVHGGKVVEFRQIIPRDTVEVRENHQRDEHGRIEAYRWNGRIDHTFPHEQGTIRFSGGTRGVCGSFMFHFGPAEGYLEANTPAEAVADWIDDALCLNIDHPEAQG